MSPIVSSLAARALAARASARAAASVVERIALRSAASWRRPWPGSGAASGEPLSTRVLDGRDRREVSWLPSLSRRAFPAPCGASGCRVACGGLVCSVTVAGPRRSLTGLPRPPILGFVAGSIAQLSGCGRIACRPTAAIVSPRHALEGTRWESGTDAQRYGQRAEMACCARVRVLAGDTDIRTLFSRMDGQVFIALALMRVRTEMPPSATGRRSIMMRPLTCRLAADRAPAPVRCWCLRQRRPPRRKRKSKHLWRKA